MHMAYVSAAVEPLDGRQLSSLIALARDNNSRVGVTGMLMYLNGSFMQVVEGTPEAVTVLFDRISADPRHHKIRILLQEPIQMRAFGDWSMGLAQLDAADLNSIEGVNDFFTNGRSLFALEPGTAKYLLIGFRGGRWRQAIS
jgi:hypothetical protein